jgi:hypothetical protein
VQTLAWLHLAFVSAHKVKLVILPKDLCTLFAASNVGALHKTCLHNHVAYFRHTTRELWPVPEASSLWKS